MAETDCRHGWKMNHRSLSHPFHTFILALFAKDHTANVESHTIFQPFSHSLKCMKKQQQAWGPSLSESVEARFVIRQGFDSLDPAQHRRWIKKDERRSSGSFLQETVIVHLGGKKSYLYSVAFHQSCTLKVQVLRGSSVTLRILGASSPPWTMDAKKLIFHTRPFCQKLEHSLSLAVQSALQWSRKHANGIAVLRFNQ